MAKKKTTDETVETKEEVTLEEPEKQESEEKEPEQENQKPEEKEPEQENQKPEEKESEQENQKPEEKEPEQENQKSEEKESEQEETVVETVLFCVTPKEKKVALRSTPEFRLDNKNLAGMVDENSETRVFKVVEKKNGYGRLLYPEGLWIDLKACNRL